MCGSLTVQNGSSTAVRDDFFNLKGFCKLRGTMFLHSSHSWAIHGAFPDPEYSVPLTRSAHVGTPCLSAFFLTHSTRWCQKESPRLRSICRPLGASGHARFETLGGRGAREAILFESGESLEARCTWVFCRPRLVAMTSPAQNLSRVRKNRPSMYLGTWYLPTPWACNH